MKRVAPALLIAVTVMVGACATGPSQASVSVTGRLVAGPTCPVETNPPDPACAPRPVAGARVVGIGGGHTVEAVSGDDGRFDLELAPGSWTVRFDPVRGLMAPPDPVAVEVDEAPIDVGEFAYDTGIR